MPSSVITSLLLPDLGGPGLVAEVLGADATATTYLLNCPDGTDSNECGVYNNSITLGPWASKTVSPGAASTGEFDQFITVSDEADPWRFSLHCEMSRTVPQKCTTININGNDDGSPTATFTLDDFDDMWLATFSHVAVTITAGQELLSATHAGSHNAAATATADESNSAQSTAGDMAATKGLGSETSGVDGSSSAASPESTSEAASCLARVLITASLAGMATIMVLS